ncbi:hypothetical protein BH09VER1_BH09VER1_35150 [soil metagenome]
MVQHATPALPLKEKVSPSGAVPEDVIGLLDVGRLGLVRVDPSGHVAAWNLGAADMLGWSEHDALGVEVSHIFSRRELISPDGSASWTASSQTRDGQTLELKVSMVPSPPSEGGAKCFLLADISESKFLERALLEAADREQRRIGQDLHDHLCQHLVGAAFSAKAQAGALDREGSPHASQLHDLARLINDAVMQVRDISRGLHPVELDSAGLMSALQELTHRVKNSVPCTFRCTRKVLVKDTLRALHVYRIAQEAVANALQHTKPRHILIVLSESGKSARLEVTDDGTEEGELTSDKYGTVAKTLQYRAQAINGSMSATFQRGHGTKLVCNFPKSS